MSIPKTQEEQIRELRRLVQQVGAKLIAPNGPRRRFLSPFTICSLQSLRRAGSLLAQDVKEAGMQIRAELQKDIDAAGMEAAHLVYKVDQAHKRPAMIRWITVGLSLAVVLLVFGVYVGMYLHG